MKRKFTLLTTAFVLLAFLAIPFRMWGQTRSEVTYTFSDHFNSNSTELSNLSFDDAITAAFEKGSGSTAPQYYTNGYAVRWYGGNTLEIVSSNATMSQIEFTYSQKNKNVTADVGSYNHTSAIWTGSDSSVTFTVESGSGHNRVSAIKVTYTISGSTPTVASPTFMPNGGGFLDSQEVSISCATDGATIYYTTDGNDPTTSSTQYSDPFTITATTTIKAFAVKNGYDDSAITSVTFTKASIMTVAEAIAALNDNSPIADAYVSGIVSQVDEVNTQYGNATYWISDDGNSNALEVYRGKYLENANFTSTDQILSGDEVVVYGTLTYYNNTTYEFTSGNYLISLNRPVPAVETPTFSPAGGTYTEPQTVTISCATPEVDIYYTTDGTDPDDESEPYSGPFTVSETTTIKAIAYDGNDHNSAVATVTYTIQLPAPTLTFNKIEGHNPVEGQIYMIVDLHSGRALTSENGSSSSPDAVEVTITNNQIITDDTNLQWTFETVEGGYIIHPVGNSTSWLYTISSSNSGVRVGDNEAKVWTLDITDETGSDYHGFMNNATSRYLGVYNNQDWRAYTSIHANIKDTQIALFVNGEAPAPAPSFTIENNNEIAYDATSGSFNFTVNNPVEGGTTTLSEDVDWISNAAVSGNSVTFTTTVNNNGVSRQGVITLTYTYNRATVTKNVTVTQAGNPNATMTIAEVRAQGTGDVATIGTVTSCVGTTAYIQDATAAICVFGSELTVGDNIRVSGTLSDYHGLLEITNPEVTVLSSGNTITPEVMTVAEINASTNQGWYIRIEEATVTAISGQNTTVAQGENTIVVRGISSDVTYAVNDILTLDGNIGCYNGAQIANPQNVEVQQNFEPSITVVPATVNAPFAGAEGTLTVTYEDVISDDAEVYFCDAQAMPATYDWINAGINDEYNVYYSINANQGEARTAYLMVVVGEIASSLVTINQAEYVTPPTPGDWVLTNLADLTEDDVFVIVGTYEDPEHDSYAMSNNNGTSNPPAAIGVIVAENTLSGEIADTLQWNIRITDDGYMFYPNGDTTTWLYCNNTNNGVRVGTNTNNVFTMTEEGYLYNTATGRYIGIYNTQDWRCYTSINNNIKDQTFAFYKKVTSETITQTITLAQGINWVSFYVETDMDALKDALIEALPSATNITIKSQKNGQTSYNGTRWRGALSTLDLALMYQITVPEGCEILLEAMPIDPANHPITIKNGPNWIGFPFNESMTPTVAFAEIAFSGDVLKSKTQQTNYNGTRWRGALTNLVPGQGYIYNSADPTDKVFTFPLSK